MTIEEAAKKWGCSKKTVNNCLRAGLVLGAYVVFGARGRYGKMWFIPDDAARPKEKRTVKQVKKTCESIEQYIWNHQGTKTIGEIAKECCISTKTVTKIYDRVFIAKMKGVSV